MAWELISIDVLIVSYINLFLLVFGRLDERDQKLREYFVFLQVVNTVFAWNPIFARFQNFVSFHPTTGCAYVVCVCSMRMQYAYVKWFTR